MCGRDSEARRLGDSPRRVAMAPSDDCGAAWSIGDGDREVSCDEQLAAALEEGWQAFRSGEGDARILRRARVWGSDGGASSSGVSWGLSMRYGASGCGFKLVPLATLVVRKRMLRVQSRLGTL